MFVNFRGSGKQTRREGVTAVTVPSNRVAAHLHVCCFRFLDSVIELVSCSEFAAKALVDLRKPVCQAAQLLCTKQDSG